jgi:hypothetical protein
MFHELIVYSTRMQTLYRSSNRNLQILCLLFAILPDTDLLSKVL